MVRFEVRVGGPEGKKGLIACSIKPVRDNKGKVLWLITEGQDITERKQAEEALRESEKRLRYLSSHILAVQENERKRVAQDIHDGIGQYLSAVKYRVEELLVKNSGQGFDRKKIFQWSILAGD